MYYYYYYLLLLTPRFFFTFFNNYKLLIINYIWYLSLWVFWNISRKFLLFNLQSNCAQKKKERMRNKRHSFDIKAKILFIQLSPTKYFLKNKPEVLECGSRKRRNGPAVPESRSARNYSNFFLSSKRRFLCAATLPRERNEFVREIGAALLRILSSSRKTRVAWNWPCYKCSLSPEAC